MLNLSAFNHNHHASRVKMVAKFIRRGIRVLLFLLRSLEIGAVLVLANDTIGDHEHEQPDGAGEWKMVDERPVY